MFQFEDKFALFDMTPVDNQFIQEYLPIASGDAVRVYLYGLMRCYHPEAGMSMTQMCHELNLPEEEITKAYRYWERKGLIQRVSDDPPAYRYVSLRRGVLGGQMVQELDPDYEDFVDSVYGVFDHGRRLHGAEIRTCYEWVEDLKLPQESVLMLLKHMERNHGKNFSIASAGQMALQMAQENIHTVEEAEEFLSRDQAVYQGTKAVLRRLGKRNDPSMDQLEMYRKWTEEWGFTPQAVEEACVETARGDPSMGFLDGILRNLRQRTGAGETMDQKGVQQARREASGLRKVLKALGSGSVTEENLAWYRRVRESYPEEMMLLAARESGYNRGSLEDAEKLLDSWRKRGITTAPEAEKYIQEFRARGELLKELRKMWGLSSLAGTKNHALVAAWEGELGFDRDMILAAAEEAAGTERPMAYLDSILRNCAENGIRTRTQLAQAHADFQQERKEKKAGGGAKPAKQVIAQQYSQRNYTGAGESLEEMMKRLEGDGKADA